MNIAIDLTQVPPNKTGIGIYALNLVRQIISMDLVSRNLCVYFFTQDDDDQWRQTMEEKKNDGCRLITIKSSRYRKLFLRFLFEQFLFPRQRRKLNIDIIFSLHYTMPYLTGIRRVVMIPDMTFYLFPQLHQKIKRLYFKGLIPVSLKRSDRIITISESTKTDILNRFTSLEEEKVAVTHLGVSPVEPVPEGRSIQYLESFGLKSKHYFLFVGTLEPRKNITAIIHAFHKVINNRLNRDGTLKLVIAGGKGWFYESIFQTVKEYGLEELVVFTGYVDEEEKQALLKHAYVFVYPSFYEGFGLPILEAMAHGVPVVTGNVSSLPEVAGDAALLMDPNKWEEIAEAMQTLLDDGRLYKELAEKSRKQAESFTWRSTTEKTLAIFESLRQNNN
ncbi:MAG: glycosyltransferase family 4 protein [bacterium]|nr:glycosyltransferase family 4 protein [bacterium]